MAAYMGVMQEMLPLLHNRGARRGGGGRKTEQQWVKKGAGGSVQGVPYNITAGYMQVLQGQKSRYQYLHHVSGGELQQHQGVVSVHTLIVGIAILTGCGAIRVQAEELGGGAHEHVVVEQGEGAEPASGDKHVLLVQGLLGDLQLACTAGRQGSEGGW